jgi:hypothetical protein
VFCYSRDVPGVPVRLSAWLTERARKAAAFQDRSLTEQVEHWARLGERVEAALTSESVKRLKAASHDPKLEGRLADTAEKQRQTRDLVMSRPGPWYGIAPDDPTVIIRRDPDGTETRGRSVDGKFVPLAAPARRGRRRSA